MCTLASEDEHLHNSVLLQTFRTWIMTTDRCGYVRGIFDNGSQSIFIREFVSKKLELKALGEVELSINAFGDSSDQQSRARRLVQGVLKSQYDNEKHEIVAIEVPVICKDVLGVPTECNFVRKLSREKKCLADAMVFPGVHQEPGISLLVGADQVWKLLTREVCSDTEERCLVAINSKFGWTLQGPVDVGTPIGQTISNVCVLKAEAMRSSDIAVTRQQFWEIESIGINDASRASDRDNGVLAAFCDSGNEKWEILC